MKTINENQFDSKFCMVKNHIDDNASLNGCMFETYSEEFEYILSIESSKRVWTYLEDDKGLFFVTGMKQSEWLMNPIGYFVTDKPYKNEMKVRLD